MKTGGVGELQGFCDAIFDAFSLKLGTKSQKIDFRMLLSLFGRRWWCRGNIKREGENRSTRRAAYHQPWISALFLPMQVMPMLMLPLHLTRRLWSPRLSTIVDALEHYLCKSWRPALIPPSNSQCGHIWPLRSSRCSACASLPWTLCIDFHSSWCKSQPAYPSFGISCSAGVRDPSYPVYHANHVLAETLLDITLLIPLLSSSTANPKIGLFRSHFWLQSGVVLLILVSKFFLFLPKSTCFQSLTYVLIQILCNICPTSSR